MKVIEPKAEILKPDLTPESIDAIYRNIEEAGRTCYKSKNKEVEQIEKEIEAVTKTNTLSAEKKKAEIRRLEELLLDAKNKSARKFVQGLVKRGHEAMIEHAFMTVRFTVDRGVSHELVRHRIASFAQESTRYCRYIDDKFGNELTFIKPFFWEKGSKEYSMWETLMFTAEAGYMHFLNIGATPEQARSVLPNSLKTEVIMTANMREWRNIFKLRAAGTTGKPHPQMAEVMIPLLQQCQELMPELFGDIEVQDE